MRFLHLVVDLRAIFLVGARVDIFDLVMSTMALASCVATYAATIGTECRQIARVKPLLVLGTIDNGALVVINTFDLLVAQLIS